jgi:hypothetical protein
MAQVTIILYRPVIDFMKSWEGDIGLAVHRLADNIAVAQRVFAPKKTGRLVESISVGARSNWPRGIQISVGANPSRGTSKKGYAWWTSEGALPHPIDPKPRNKTGELVFFWAKVGHVVRLKHVNHPGIRNPSHWVMRGGEAGVAGWFG